MAFFEPITACALTIACLSGPVHPGGSTLELSLTEAGGNVSAVTLNCDRAGGSHPKSGPACATLAAADGDFARLKPRTQVCPLIYAPVDAAAVGSWHGEPVVYRTTYVNRCSAGSKSGGVFAF